LQRDWQCLISEFALVAVLACGQRGHEVSSTAQCVGDTDCSSGFCDGDTCAEAGQSETFGRSCGPIPVDENTGEPYWRLDVCGSYLCKDGRCRSCVSDEECKAKVSGLTVSRVTCGVEPGRPGRSCGDYSFTPAPENTSPPTTVPAPPRPSSPLPPVPSGLAPLVPDDEGAGDAGGMGLPT
jgi:hypothetical protein